MSDNTDELSELDGVDEIYEYGGSLEVRFTQDALEGTIACIMSWAGRNGCTVTVYEESTPESSENVMVLAWDPDGELASWKDKLEGDEVEL